MDKQESRLRRARATRIRIRLDGHARLTVHRTNQHLYAQVISPEGKVLASASTTQKVVAADLKGTKNMAAAEAVGKAIAERRPKPPALKA
jgi:large subunit ribosomal protein L18